MFGEKGRIFQVCEDGGLRKSRDAIMRFHGYDVISAGSHAGAAVEATNGGYNLVLVDATGSGGVAAAQRLCDEIKRLSPGQHVAYVCNHLVYVESTCPNEVIQTEFDPEAFVRSVQSAMEDALANAR